MNFLVVATTAVGYYMAARGRGDWAAAAHTLLGTALTAAGASVLNQYVRARLDATDAAHRRPPPARRPRRPGRGAGVGVVLAVGGVVDARGLRQPADRRPRRRSRSLSYVFVYTPLKRRTTLSTVVGAIPGAIPPVMGCTAVRGTMSAEALALFAILFLWQMPHFLAIAILYRDDYAAGGFRMLPVVDERLSRHRPADRAVRVALIPVGLLPAAPGDGRPGLSSSPRHCWASGSFGSAWLRRDQDPPRRPQAVLASIIYLPVLLASMVVD